jgi:hypothetical protein
MLLDVVDAAAMRKYEHDLDGLTVLEAEKALERAQDIIDDETSWAEALSAFVRNHGILP